MVGAHDIKTAVPTGEQHGKRRGITPRDVLATLGIALLIATIVFFVNGRRGLAEGAFSKANTLAGLIPTGPAPVVGNVAPDFEVALLDGGTFRLSEHRGHTVWINFWATWCPPCRAEMPDIEKVWQERTGDGMVILGLNYAESTPTVRRFVDKLGITFPIGLDRDGTVGATYRLAGFPSHFFVDRDGVLREIRVGLMTEATMRKTLERLGRY